MHVMEMPADTAAREIAPTLRIVDTTLREGEQFARAHFTSEQRLELARRLDAFGVDILELPSPMVSTQTAADVRAIAAMGLRARGDTCALRRRGRGGGATDRRGWRSHLLGNLAATARL